MAKDYYQILGVSKTASAEEIKRAYRKLAHEHHPDKSNGEAKKFKEINEAYQILSNPQKRSQYDQFGTAGDQSDFGGFNQNTQGFSGFEGFSSGGFGFGGIGDIFEDMFGGVFSQVQTEVSIPLTSAILGEKMQFKTSSNDLIELSIPPGTQDGTSFRFRGKGGQMRSSKRGDLIITIRVQLPKRLSRKQKELLEELKKIGL